MQQLEEESKRKNKALAIAFLTGGTFTSTYLASQWARNKFGKDKQNPPQTENFNNNVQL